MNNPKVPRPIDLDVMHLSAQETLSSLPVLSEEDRKIKHTQYWTSPEDIVKPDVDIEAVANNREVHDLLAEVISQNEQYTLTSASIEDVFTMSRAVASVGNQVAESRQVEQSKVAHSLTQLAGVAAYMGKDPRAWKTEAVDAPTYILTALSLKRVQEAIDDREDPEYKAAGYALEALRNVPESLDRIRKEETLGPHTGEIAVAAVMNYQPPTV